MSWKFSHRTDLDLAIKLNSEFKLSGDSVLEQRIEKLEEIVLNMK